MPVKGGPNTGHAAGRGGGRARALRRAGAGAAHGPCGGPLATLGPVRNLVKLLFLTALAAVVSFVARGLLDERAPRRELTGDGPILGSLDTWPPVPKKTAA